MKETTIKMLPLWLRQKSSNLHELKKNLRSKNLHTVCEEAMCPNIGECWEKRTATFMILGDVCTRRCGFCAVKSSAIRGTRTYFTTEIIRGTRTYFTTEIGTCPPNPNPLPLGERKKERGRLSLLDPEEPENIARMVTELGLRHAVITSVTRDDLPDGGAGRFAATIRAVREKNPETTVEVLTPDFQGDPHAIEIVLGARPDIFNHNVETVRRLTPVVRNKALYERSLSVLSAASSPSPLPSPQRGEGITSKDSSPFGERIKVRGGHQVLVKSGLMVGLGETKGEVEETLYDLKNAGCDIVTIGQYLRPSRRNIPVAEYVHPSVFDYYREVGYKIGFKFVASAPMVRSSYHAEEMITI